MTAVIAINEKPAVIVNSKKSIIAINEKPAVIVNNKKSIAVITQRGLQGIKGDKGDKGDSGQSNNFIGTFQAAENMQKGMPVYLSKINGQLYKTDAAVILAAECIGVINENVTAGFSVTVISGNLEIADWSDITGSAALLTGQNYFLNISGGLTTATPTLPDFKVSCLVGKAINSSTLNVYQSLNTITL